MVVSRGFAAYLASGSWQRSALELLNGALEMTGSDTGCFAVVPAQGALRLLAWRGEGWSGLPTPEAGETKRRANDPGTVELPLGDNLASEAVRTGKSVVFGRAVTWPIAFGLPPGQVGLDNLLVVPVADDDRVIGLIALANRRGGYDAGTQHEVEVLAGLGGVLCRAYLEARKRRSLEDQLRHSQRMEAVGRLAGGIAHDFNNLLQVINGYSDLLLEMVGQDAAMKDIVERVRRAGSRAGALTRQLLAFSRKQVLEPRLVDFAALVDEAQKMFMRLISEDIEVRVERQPGGWTVHADPGQLEQVLMNLVVNARDAMPDGGRILIETANVTRSGAELAEDIPSGRYVRLSVSDSGHGIPPGVLPHIFEPFYTTKAADRGTGLGLSTVHGIVAQSDGHVRVYSEVGRGTTFHVYVPAVDRPAEAAAAPEPARAGGSETVLLVEDEADIRTVCERMLARAGYTVLSAENPSAALDVLTHHDGPIHLLLTDVVMPGGSGPALVSQMRPLRPDTAVVYMSGYTEHASLRSGLIEPGACFLNKPFDRQSLLGTLQRALADRPGGRREERAALPRALVVDDALMNRELVQALVQSLGWTCDPAGGGEEALARLQNQRYDLVFLDCRMPAPDGYETARRVRRRDPDAVWRTPATVPLVGVTAALEAGERERCLAAGMNDYLPKPVSRDDLARAIEHWYRPAPARPGSAVSDRMRRLEGELGRASTERLGRLFLIDLADKRARLEVALRTQDGPELVAAAHAIRGSAANLGAQALADACAALEARARAHQLTDLDELWRRFEAEADRAQDEVTARGGH